MKKIGLLLIGVIFYTAIFAQGENTAHQWYFGENAGVDFSTGIPVAKTDGQITGWEGCATVGDINGSLLFYTDGQNIYNRNHQVMQNGGGLMGSWSASQSSIIVPYPGNDSLFYVFTVDAIDNQLLNGLRYSIVNMNLNSGLGGVTSTKNILLETPVAEKVFSIMHANNSNVWVIAHRWDSDEFVAYEVSSSGVNTVPVVSAIGAVHQGGYSANPNFDGWTNAIGQIKSNISGTLIATTEYKLNTIELFDFDKQTGVLSNCYTSDANYNFNFGIEFSPNSDYLYVSSVEISPIHSKLYQFNISQINPFDNPVLISSGEYGSGVGMAGLQVAPNGKIYVVDDKNPYLGVINNPNNAGLLCSYQEQALFLEGEAARRGLPNLFYYKGFAFFTGSEQDTLICQGDSAFFENNWQTVTGTYYDTVQTSLNWDSIINTHLTILPVTSTPTISENSDVLTSSSAINYQWYYNGSLISGATNQSYQPFVSGVYQVVVSNNNECETWSDEYNFVVAELKEVWANLNVYPNPVSNVINIDYTELFSIQITDLNGHNIYKESTLSNNKSVDITLIENGLYILKIITPTKVKTMKIIKQ